MEPGWRFSPQQHRRDGSQKTILSNNYSFNSASYDDSSLKMYFAVKQCVDTKSESKTNF